ncbi:hypothetical protein AAVH_21493 [Aphelenchoides avenae]|nr:hypothetical protein AAVH_21493 [Aphelenchus avenae]
MLPSTSIAAISRRGRGAAVPVKSTSNESYIEHLKSQPLSLTALRRRQKLAREGRNSESVPQTTSARVTPAPTVTPPSPTDEDPAWLKFKAEAAIKPPLKPQYAVQNPRAAEATQPIQSSSGAGPSGVGEPRPILSKKAKMRHAIEATLRAHYGHTLQLCVLYDHLAAKEPQAVAHFDGGQGDKLLEFLKEHCAETVDMATFPDYGTYVALR